MHFCYCVLIDITVVTRLQIIYEGICCITSSSSKEETVHPVQLNDSCLRVCRRCFGLYLTDLINLLMNFQQMVEQCAVCFCVWRCTLIIWLGEKCFLSVLPLLLLLLPDVSSFIFDQDGWDSLLSYTSCVLSVRKQSAKSAIIRKTVVSSLGSSGRRVSTVANELEKVMFLRTVFGCGHAQFFHKSQVFVLMKSLHLARFLLHILSI